MRTFNLNLAVIILLLVGFLGFNSLFVISEGNVGIVTRFGKVVRTSDAELAVSRPGLHFKIPFIDKVRVLDARIQTLSSLADRFVTAEKKDLIIDSYVKWRISDPSTFYLTTAGGNIMQAEELLRRRINNSLRSQIGRLTIHEIVSGQEQAPRSNYSMLSNSLESPFDSAVSGNVANVANAANTANEVNAANAISAANAANAANAESNGQSQTQAQGNAANAANTQGMSAGDAAFSNLQNAMAAENLRGSEDTASVSSDNFAGDELENMIANSKREQVMQNALRDLGKNSAELGIAIVDVRIKQINLPPEVSNSIYQRMRAERDAVAKLHRSQGRREAEAIKAQADREVAVMIATAEREARRVMGNGDAEATKIYATAYSQSPELFNFLRSMDAYKKSMSRGNDVLVLEPDSEFFRFFKNPD